LLISIIWFPDISISIFWYQECVYIRICICICICICIFDSNSWNYWYQQFQILISGIHLLISGIQIKISRIHCWYQEYLLISTILDINNWHCWYQELQLLWCDGALLISVIQFLDISNNNWFPDITNVCTFFIWYQECVHIIDINNSYFWYQQLELLISTVPIFDIRNSFGDIRNSNSWYH